MRPGCIKGRGSVSRVSVTVTQCGGVVEGHGGAHGAAVICAMAGGLQAASAAAAAVPAGGGGRAAGVSIGMQASRRADTGLMPFVA